MDQLIDTIVQRTGISRTHAEQAVQIAMNQLKSRLPAPVHSQIDRALASSGDGAETSGKLGSALGSMLRG